MNRITKRLTGLFLFFVLAVRISDLLGQGVTTARISGSIEDETGEALIGANIVVIHEPSGSQYGAVTQPNGRFNIPGLRVGGPYSITLSFIGYNTVEYKNIKLGLGQNYVINTTMVEETSQLESVTIHSKPNPILNDEHSGTSTNVNKESISTLPTLGRSVSDFTRMTPQSSGESFAGQDPKAINFSLDGSTFNNAFGLTGSVPGAPTNSTPISLDAIEEIQIDIAPYDVTQGGFTGAGINAVTRSGTNEFEGSFFYNTRNERLVGRNAIDTEVETAEFNVEQYGFRLGGPIIKDKLFFFINGEVEKRMDPNSPFIADAPGRTGANVTRVLQSEMDQLRSFLIEQYGYDPGLYEGYNLFTDSHKFLAKLDYNINQNHKLSARFNMMLSSRERPGAATSLGFGGRNLNLFSLSFQNNNYLLHDNTYSGIVELNSRFGSKITNNMKVGFTANRNFRSYGGGDFPAVDILKDGRNYISFGTDILSPNRALDADTWQFQNNISVYLGNHLITAGVNFEAFRFAYTFTPAYFGQYVFNSLEDFYSSAAGEEVEMRRYQRSYSGLEGGAVPTTITQAYIPSIYIQDEFNITKNLSTTYGIRLDVPFYGNTAIRNPEVENLDFYKPDGDQIQIRTDRLPTPQYMFSPRLGFNWDILGNRSFQLRGGTGLFSGRPIYVNISNMINSSGLTLGQLREDNTTNYPFSPDVSSYIPGSLANPESYDLSYIDPNFRNPQVWRSNLALDKELFWGIVGTFEGLYTKQVSDLIFYDSNLRPSTRNLAGPDNRPIYGYSDENNRLHDHVTNAVVLANTNEGYSYSLTAQLHKSFNNGLTAMGAYNYGVSKNMVDGNTQHYLSYENIHAIRGGNLPELGFSLDDQRHRIISSVSYRKEYLKKMASSVSLFFEARNQGVFSYVYGGDLNGDLIAGNDLLYVPTEGELAQMRFQELVLNDGRVISPDQQRAVFNDFINQDPHLSGRRGDYAQRHGVQLPMVSRLDISFKQEFFVDVKGKRNTIQLRADIFNFTNMLNKNWGVGSTVFSETPLTVVDIDESNVPTYMISPVGNRLPQNSFVRTANIGDVWQMQLGVRYIFN